MTEYPDRRSRYSGLNPADFEPGVGRHDNTAKPPADLVRVKPAKRGSVPGENFRVTTDPDNPANQPPPEPVEPPKPAFDAVPDPSDSEI
jgi:hypothetical protein